MSSAVNKYNKKKLRERAREQTAREGSGREGGVWKGKEKGREGKVTVGWVM